MADHVGELDDRYAGFKLFYNKGVAEIIDLGTFDTGYAEVAVYGGSDVADQEWIASLCDKEGGIFGFWAFFNIFFDSSFGGRI